MNDQPITPTPLDDETAPAAAQAEAPEVYGARDAAAYLGISYRTLKALVYGEEPSLVPDSKIGGILIFYKPTLDDFLAERAEHMSTDDAAAYLGVERKTIYYYMHKMTPEGSRLVPTFYRGDRPFFSKAALEPFRGRKRYVRGQFDVPGGKADEDDLVAAGRQPGGPNDFLNRLRRAQAQQRAAPQPA